MKKQSVLSRLMGDKDAPIILLDEATAGEKSRLIARTGFLIVFLGRRDIMYKKRGRKIW